MKKIMSVVGARPQFVKAAVLSAEFQRARIDEVMVNTGQHYDEQLSEVFFQDLGLPTPHHQLQVGSGTHGAQTAKMLAGIEEVLFHERPSLVLVYGDTNSTLGGISRRSQAEYTR